VQACSYEGSLRREQGMGHLGILPFNEGISHGFLIYKTPLSLMPMERFDSISTCYNRVAVTNLVGIEKETNSL